MCKCVRMTTHRHTPLVLPSVRKWDARLWESRARHFSFYVWWGERSEEETVNGVIVTPAAFPRLFRVSEQICEAAGAHSWESLQWHSELYKTGSGKAALKAQGKIWLQSRSVLSVRMAKTSCLVCCHVTSDSHSLGRPRSFTLSFPVHNPILSSLILSCFLFLSPGSELSVWMSCVCVLSVSVYEERNTVYVCVCVFFGGLDHLLGQLGEYEWAKGRI